MRKLLSLLAITGIAGSASVNVVSCGSKSSGDTLKDISKMDLTTMTLSVKKTGSALYDAVRTKLANYAGGDVTAAAIKADDSDVGIAIGGETGIIADDTTTVISDTTFDVKVKVDDGNKGFTTVDGYVFSGVSVTNDISKLKFLKTEAQKGSDLYTVVRTQLAAYGGTTAAVIKGDDNVRIAIGGEKGGITDNDTAISDGVYTVKISANDAQKVFTPTTDGIETSITIGKSDLKDIKFSPTQPITTAADLGTEVRTEIAGYAGFGVTADDIKNSQAVKISILTGNTEIPDDASVQFTAKTSYDVKIMADDNPGFNNSSWIETTIEFTGEVKKVDVSQKKVTAPTNLQKGYTGSQLYTAIRTQIAGGVTQITISADTIKAADNVLIAIGSSEGKIIADDGTVLTTGTYNVKFITLDKNPGFSQMKDGAVQPIEITVPDGF